jgi:YVTN family beta-propeller protein
MLPRVVTAALAVSLALQGTPSVQAQTPGRLLVVNKAEASLSVVDLAQRKEIARIPTGDAPHEVAVSPDGQIAVVTNYGTRAEPGNTLTVVDLGTLQPVATIDLGVQV